MVFQKMVFQKNGFPKYGFSIKKRFLNQKMENYIFSILWLNKIFSNSWKSIPGTTQILEKMRIYHKMDKSICFQKSGKLKFLSIKKWFSKIWFLNQKTVSQSKCASTTDSSKCASTTDSSCFRTIIECITSYDSSVWFPSNGFI